MKLKINNETGELTLSFNKSEEAVNLLEAAALGADDFGVRKTTQQQGLPLSDRDAIAIIDEARRTGKFWDQTAVQILEEATF